MRDFAAIDFETANYKASSVCSVGIVFVRDSAVAETFYSLIRPVPNYYTFTYIHGIDYYDTKNAGSFPEVWAEIAPKIAGLPLAAHFSRFDEGCLKAVHEAYNMEYPGYEFYCTCQASRKAFGKTLPNHKLVTVAKHCGYNLEQHHNALADATACAQIGLALAVGVRCGA